MSRSGLREQPEALAGINLLAQGAPPPLVIEIPSYRLLDSRLERLFRTPTEFRLEFGGVDRIAPIVTRPVSDEGNQRGVGLGGRAQAVENRADRLHDIDVAPLAAAADIVFLAHGAAPHDEVERACVVLDEKPVPDVLASAVDR